MSNDGITTDNPSPLCHKSTPTINRVKTFQQRKYHQNQTATFKPMKQIETSQKSQKNQSIPTKPRRKEDGLCSKPASFVMEASKEEGHEYMTYPATSPSAS